MEEFEFFWNGPYSQWHPSPFEIGGVTYGCAEQYMMAEKARCFGDNEALEEIMATNNPRKQKAIGRRVRNFVAEVWTPRSYEVVMEATVAKFDQNPDLREILLSTGNKTIVEASYEDRIWGIGLPEGDPRTLSRDSWLGTNWLGEIVTKVRDQIRKEGDSDETQSPGDNRSPSS
jgi:ribA/ribD-fused uncharacterized protein